MRKLMIATTLTLVLAGTMTAAPRERDRDDRKGESSIVRIVKLVKVFFGTRTNILPTVPIP